MTDERIPIARLSNTRARILSEIARCEQKGWAPLTAREIAEECGEHHRASDWANGPLREMAWHGIVCRVGVGISSASTWGFTAAGRRWFAQAIAARRAETGTGSVHESAVAESDAPKDYNKG